MLGNVNKHSERFYKGGTFRAGTWTYDYFNRMDNIFESARKVAAFQYRDRIPQKMLAYETKLRDSLVLAPSPVAFYYLIKDLKELKSLMDAYKKQVEGKMDYQKVTISPLLNTMYKEVDDMIPNLEIGFENVKKEFSSCC